VKYVIEVGYKETIPSATAWSWSYDYCLFSRQTASKQTGGQTFEHVAYR